MSQKYPLLSSIFPYSEDKGFEFTGVLAEIIPKEYQDLAPAEITPNLDLSFLEGTLRKVRKIDGISKLPGDRTQNAKKIIEELKTYYTQKKVNPLAEILSQKKAPVFSFKGEPLTIDNLKGRDIDLEYVRLNRGINLNLAIDELKKVNKFITNPAFEKVVTPVQIRNLEKLLVFAKSLAKPKRKPKDFTFTIEDRNIFFGRSSDIEPMTVSRSYEYWEEIKKGLASFVEKIKKFEDIVNEEDSDGKKYLDFVKNEKYDYLNYIVEYPEKNVFFKAIDERVAEFIIDYLSVYGVLQQITGKDLMSFSNKIGPNEDFENFFEDSDNNKKIDELASGKFGSFTQEGQEADEEYQRATSRVEGYEAYNEQIQRKVAEIDMTNITELADIDTDKMLLDPISIIAVKRNSENFTTDIEIEFFKELANEKFEKIIQYFSKTSVPFSKEDIDNFQGFLGSLREFEEEKSGSLPIFFASSSELADYYPEYANQAKEVQERINKFFTLFKNAIEKNNTFLPKNVSLMLESGRPSKNVSGSQKRQMEETGKYMRQITPSNKPALNINKENIDLIKEIIDDIGKYFFEPIDNNESYGLELPFDDNDALHIIMTYGESERFEGHNRLYSKFVKRGTKTFRTGLLKRLAKIMKNINEGFTSLKNAQKQFQEYISTMAKIYGVSKGDSYYETIVSEAASMLGSIKNMSGNTEEITLGGKNVDEEYNLIRDSSFADMSALKTLIKFFERNSQNIYFGEKEDSKANQYINSITKEMKNLKKSTVESRLLEVHDSLRILKNETIYFGLHDLDDYDSMQNMITKMQNHFSRDVTANELTNVVTEINSFDDISKSYGISKEEVYFIKANFR